MSLHAPTAVSRWIGVELRRRATTEREARYLRCHGNQARFARPIVDGRRCLAPKASGQIISD